MDCLDLSITNLGKGGWHGVGNSVRESANGADGGVGRETFGNGKIVGGEFNSFDDPFSLGFWDVHSVAPKVFRSAANVTTGDAIE